MKTVLSIDFDLIMKPSIEAYNNMVNGDGPEGFVSALGKKYPFLQCLPADLEIYKTLTEYLNKIPKDKKVFIKDHKEAFQLVKDFAKGEKVNLINIDHHHDIEYQEPPFVTKAPTDANWVKWLYKEGVVEKYTWIRNNNSHMPFDHVQEEFPDVEYMYFEKEMLNGIESDYVILCLSPAWVPPMYYPLYDMWKTL